MSQDGENGDEGYEFRVWGQDTKREGGSRNFSGEGTAKYKNGDVYDGMYVEGRRANKGIYDWAKTGDRYEGAYADNQKKGFGKMIYSGKGAADDASTAGDAPSQRLGCVYVGYFSAGKRGCQEADLDKENPPESDGTFTYASGDVYVGQWLNGKKHGSGTYSYKKDDTKIVGDWEEGKIVRGKWMLPNGTFWLGKFKHNKPDGHGVWVFKDGSQVIGEYVQTMRDDQAVVDAAGSDGGEEKIPKVNCRFRATGSTVVRGGGLGVRC